MTALGRTRASHQSHPAKIDEFALGVDEPYESGREPDAPSEEDRATAADLALAVTDRAWRCGRCRCTDPGLHFISPNVYGEPEVYCVQVPSYDVVDTSGGQGFTKHWGSPFGCQAVTSTLDDAGERPLGYGEYIGPVAAYLYGQPLAAMEVHRQGMVLTLQRSGGQRPRQRRPERRLCDRLIA